MYFLFTHIMSKKREYHFLENHIIKYGLKISERLPESGEVRSVVCKFCIFTEKKIPWAIMLHERKRKILNLLNILFGQIIILVI